MTDRQDAPASSTRPSGRATWRQWLGLAILTLPMLVLATDLTVLFLAMPSISADLQPGSSQMLWTLHVYGFIIAGLLITMGRLGDRIGRRRLLLFGAGAFAVLAVCAAYAVNIEMLIGARALLGIAGATLMPSTFSLLRNMFADDSQRRFAIAVVFSAFSAGGAIGPLLAGVLLEFFWWGSVFLVNAPALVLLLLIGPLLLPEYRDPDAQRLDLSSVALSLGGMLGIIYGLQEGFEHQSVWPYAVPVVFGLGLALWFVRRQLRLADPLLDLGLFANRRFSASLAAVLLTGFAMVGAFYLFTQYLQWVLELTPLQAGLWTVPYIVINIAGAMTAPVLVRRFRTAYVMGAGLALAAAGLTFAAVVGANADLVLTLTGLSVAGLGQGAAMMLGSDLIISTPPVARAGSAAAMQEVSGEFGQALGMAFIGSIGMFAYRAFLGSAMPAGVPPDAADAAQNSVTGASAVAEQLPAAVGAELLATAREGFTQALQTGLAVGAAILAGVAVLVVWLLRQPAATDDDADSEATLAEVGSEPA
ncbi:MFS transporter [Egibacter rhizosphaerae]|uniref:MFS transporter n=1 Tax=Egibacter rhizosphaerae TaxID=1670831 RepID=A0A411YET9_9ACTN|nr:MFS transporter [Egibacter rhizosphaerae]QBI19607.1 MFS transporter [Egibacter rhizosphaerae]